MDEIQSVVWKFELPAPNGQDCLTSIPAGAQLLSFGEINGKFCVWARVNPNEPARENVRFMIVGTGWDLTNMPQNYLGSIKNKMASAEFELAWHCFWEAAA